MKSRVSLIQKCKKLTYTVVHYIATSYYYLKYGAKLYYYDFQERYVLSCRFSCIAYGNNESERIVLSAANVLYDFLHYIYLHKQVNPFIPLYLLLDTGNTFRITTDSQLNDYLHFKLPLGMQIDCNTFKVPLLIHTLSIQKVLNISRMKFRAIVKGAFVRHRFGGFSTTL